MSEKSPSIAALAAALSKAQGEMSAAKKDSTNPHYKSKYADLASVWDAARGPLTKHELAVVQTCDDASGGACIVTTLMHSSGEWISGKLTLPVSKSDAQGFGSAITYARRYGLAAILGIAAEDDDGEAAVRHAEQPGHAKPQAVRDWPAVLTAYKVDVASCKTLDELNSVGLRFQSEQAPKPIRDQFEPAYRAKQDVLKRAS